MDIVVWGALAAVAWLGGWLLGVMAFFKARRALAEVTELRALLAGTPAPAPVILSGRAAEPPSIPEPERELQPARVPPPKPRIDLEVLLTQRWGVWLGTAALLLAGVFLVRTVAERGMLGPGPRCAMAAVLGAALVAGADWMRRRPAAGTMVDHAPSALAAGGVAAWFAAAYGAGPLYGFVSEMAGFVLMAAASLAGLALSLRFGKLVALAGLAGAFVTPLLVETHGASLPGLFGYLLLVSAAAWAVVRYTAWAWLGWTAGAAGAVWVLLAGMSAGADAWAPGLFVPAAAALSIWLLPGAALDFRVGRSLSWAPLLLLGLAGLALAARTGDPTVRLGVLLLAPVAVGKGWVEPRLAWLPYLPAALFLGVLLTWALPYWQATGEAVTADGVVQAILPGAWAPGAILPLLETAGAMAAWFAAMGLFLERRHVRPLPWAGLVAVVPVAALAVTYAQVGRFQPRPAWALAAAALAAGLVTAAGLARGVSKQRAGVHAAGAVAALALGFAIVLDEAWLTVAIALVLPALAWIEDAADLPPLRRVALGVAALVLVRLVLNPAVLEYEISPRPVLNGLLLAYGIPALCFAVASWRFRFRADDLVVAVLEAGACMFAAFLAALEVHHWAQSGQLGAFDPGFLEAALQVSVLGACAVALQYAARRQDRTVLRWAWRGLGLVALLGGVLLLAFNPAWTGEAVGRSLFGNALLPAYAVPAALTAAALRLGAGPRRWLAVYAVVAAFAWTTLEVRQGFHHGDLADGGMDDAELWAYSGVWLLLGAGLMAAGLWTGVRGLRLAALALVALVAGKVFLVDMAGLDGLWRVLSFLGLGLSLIGLGAFYRRFVTAPHGDGAA